MEHPIGKLMQTTLENIRDMVDVNTVIGDPVEASGGATIIPISKVSFGYVTAGGDLSTQEKAKHSSEPVDFPFAGGSGAGVSVQPVGFLVITMDGVRLLPAQNKTALERAMGCAPQLMEDIRSLLESHKEKGDQRA